MTERIQLRTAGLVKKFGAETVLDGIDLSVHQGEVVVVLGPSGCGKSTLLRCMNGLEAPTAGSVFQDGEEISSGGKNIARLRQRIGMVFQSYDLFPNKNIMDNITLAPVKVQKRPRKRRSRRKSSSGDGPLGEAQGIPEGAVRRPEAVRRHSPGALHGAGGNAL